MAAKKRENTWGKALADGRFRESLQESSRSPKGLLVAETTFVRLPSREPPYKGRDKKLLQEFGLTPMSPAVLPCPKNTFVVQLRNLTEEQARAILKAAREAGVDLEKGRSV